MTAITTNYFHQVNYKVNIVNKINEYLHGKLSDYEIHKTYVACICVCTTKMNNVLTVLSYYIYAYICSYITTVNNKNAYHT